MESALLVRALVGVPPETVALRLNQARGSQVRGAVCIEIGQRVREGWGWDPCKGTERDGAPPIGDTRQQQREHLHECGVQGEPLMDDENESVTTAKS